MAKAILIVVAIAVGGGLGATCLQLAGRVGDQEAQIERLRNDLQSLREQSDSAVSRGEISPGSFDLPNESASITGATANADEELRDLVARMVNDERVVGALARKIENRIDPSSALVGTAAFKEGVRTSMEEIREEERLSQEEERAERMVQRTEDRAREIAERLNLPQQTADELTQILVSSAQATQDLWGRRGDDNQLPRGEVRQVMRDQRNETNALVQNLLTPSEYEQYQKLSQDLNPGRRGGGGFGGPGGGQNTTNGGATNTNGNGSSGSGDAGGDGPGSGGRSGGN